MSATTAMYRAVCYTLPSSPRPRCNPPLTAFNKHLGDRDKHSKLAHVAAMRKLIPSGSSKTSFRPGVRFELIGQHFRDTLEGHSPVAGHKHFTENSR